MNEYSFNKVFGIDVDNEEIYNTMVTPMINNVLKGFNAILIAYGQTGSGKTFTMLGKPKLGVLGLLPMTLKEFIDTKSVNKLEISAVEAFGHHVAKIELFDLYQPLNQTTSWGEKKGDTSLEMARAVRKQITNIDEAYMMIRYAHAASHFAPTGKNPESSRGHVTFIAKVHQDAPDGSNNDLISFFIFLDCAGSEGETAFTPDFIASVDKTTLMGRRLEAGCINTGLSGLQIIFNELRVKGKLSKMLGNGLRRVLHPYINTKTILAVIFTFSPSVNNAKATESTLKFAVTAGMVKVQPVKAELTMNIDKLAQKLRKSIEENEQILGDQENKIIALSSELEGLKQQLVVLNLDFADIENADLAEYGQFGGNINSAAFAGSSKWKGKDVSHLQQSVIDQFKYLDEDDDDDWGDDDLMTTVKVDSNFEAQLEKDLNAAIKADRKQAGAAKLLKAAVNVDYDASQDKDDDEKLDIEALEAKLEETLDFADDDVTEIQNKMDTIASMTGKRVKMDFDTMTTDDLVGHCEETWDTIEGNRDEQVQLKNQQEKVVGHLVETNEWLFASLSETLNENL